MDSNHRRLRQLSYSQPHLATLVTAHTFKNSSCFAGTNIRLSDSIANFSGGKYSIFLNLL